MLALIVIIFSPFFVVVNVACSQIEAPDVLLARQVLVDQEVRSADSDTNFRIGSMAGIYPVLEIVLASLKLDANRLARFLLFGCQFWIEILQR